MLHRSMRAGRALVPSAALDLAATAPAAHAAATAPQDVSSSVTVNATAGLGAIPSGAIGLNKVGSTVDGSTEPAVETPFAPYYGIEMLSKLGSPGDEMVTSSTNNSLLKGRAVRRADGGLDVLPDNEDPGDTDDVSLNLSGFTASGMPTVFTLGNDATSITIASGSASSVTVPAYSLVVVQIPGSAGTGVTAPGAPGQPVVSNLTSAGAELTWPASTTGSHPVADSPTPPRFPPPKEGHFYAPHPFAGSPASRPGAAANLARGLRVRGSRRGDHARADDVEFRVGCVARLFGELHESE